MTRSSLAAMLRCLSLAYSLLIGIHCNALTQSSTSSGEGGGGRDFVASEAEQAWLDAHPHIRIAFDANYPPYSFKDNHGQYKGIAVDITHLIAEKLNITLSVHRNGQWKDIYSAAQAREVDVIATLVKRQERESWFEFTRPYLTLSQYIITQKKNTLSSRNGLAGKKVALIDGYSTSRLFIEEYPSVIPVYVTDLEAALERVARGEVFATVGDVGMANHHILTSGLSNLTFSSLFTDEQSKQRYGVRKDWPQLAVILDKALASLSYTELMEVYARWRVPDVARRESGFISVWNSLSPKEKDWLDRHQTIRLASDGFWPPFETIDASGRYYGIAADYIALIEQRLNIQFEVSPRLPWDTIIEKLAAKELDVFTAAAATPNRKTFANFTAPYISNPIVIVTQQQVGFIDGMKDLTDRAIAVEKGYASIDLIRQDYPSQRFVEYGDTQTALNAVSKGKQFAYVGNLASATYTIRDRGLTNLKISGQLSITHNLSMGVRDDWPELTSILDKTLDTISLEERQRIHKKWIDLEVEPAFSYMLIVQVLVGLLAMIIGIVIWNVILNRRVRARTQDLEYQANYDALTDLPNRYQCLQMLSKLTDGKLGSGRVHIMMLDIDDFKYVNDTLGHSSGDQLLIDIGNRLTKVLPNKPLGRLGGDEFLVVVEEQNEPIEDIIRNLINCFKLPFKVNDRDLVLTTSIGICAYPDDAQTVSDLLRFADTALHHSKKIGRNSYAYFNDSMRSQTARRLLLEEHLSLALERDEFEVFFQPKVDLAKEDINGFEALLRWHSPVLGEVSPVEFIPIAENNGLIIPLGEFVIARALSQLNDVCHQLNKTLSISINVSPRQFRDPLLVEKFMAIVQESDISIECIELELTEGVLMSANATTEQSIFELKKMGFTLAMDDFGTGYSSLSYLRNFPFDTLKIDKEFIRDISVEEADKRLTQSAIAMAHGLSLTTVGEGVETEIQVVMLKSMGCQILQGFFFGKPMPVSDIAVWYRGFQNNRHWTRAGHAAVK